MMFRLTWYLVLSLGGVLIGSFLPFICCPQLLPISSSEILPALFQSKKVFHTNRPLLFSLWVLGTVLFYFSFLLFEQQEFSVRLFLYVWCLCSIILTTSDCLFLLLPDWILLFFAVLLLIFRFLFLPASFLFHLLSALLLFLLFAVFFVISSDGMGGGDVKLAGLIGLLLGYEKSLIAILFACFLALLYGMLRGTKKNGSKRKIPFGPFLFAGSWYVIFLETSFQFSLL